MTTFLIAPCKYFVVSANISFCAVLYIVCRGRVSIEHFILERSPTKTHPSGLNLLPNRVKCNVCMVRRKPDVCHYIQFRASLKK